MQTPEAAHTEFTPAVELHTDVSLPPCFRDRLCFSVLPVENCTDANTLEHSRMLQPHQAHKPTRIMGNGVDGQRSLFAYSNTSRPLRSLRATSNDMVSHIGPAGLQFERH